MSIQSSIRMASRAGASAALSLLLSSCSREVADQVTIHAFDLMYSCSDCDSYEVKSIEGASSALGLEGKEFTLSFTSEEVESRFESQNEDIVCLVCIDYTFEGKMTERWGKYEMVVEGFSMDVDTDCCSH